MPGAPPYDEDAHRRITETARGRAVKEGREINLVMLK